MHACVLVASLVQHASSASDIARLLSTGADDDNITCLFHDYIDQSEEEDDHSVQEDDDLDDLDDWGRSDAEVAINNLRTTSSHQPLIVTNGEDSDRVEVEKASEFR